MLEGNKIFLLAFAAGLSLAGCRGQGDLLPSDAVARVGNSVLTVTETVAAIPSGTPVEDSLQMVDAYVHSWVRKQVKLQEAEKVLEKSGVDIETMVEDYRNSLLSYRLDRYYMDNDVDSLVNDSLVSQYYDTHKPEFRMDRDIVKGRIIRLPANFRLRTKLRELMGSSNPDRQQDFIDIAVKNDLKITEFDKWVSFDEMLNNLPTVRGKNYEYLLNNPKVEELTDGDYRYYIQVTDYTAKGRQAPLEWVGNVIRNIIYNKRGSDVIKAKEDSLYNAARENNTLKIYLETNKK